MERKSGRSQDRKEERERENKAAREPADEVVFPRLFGSQLSLLGAVGCVRPRVPPLCLDASLLVRYVWADVLLAIGFVHSQPRYGCTKLPEQQTHTHTHTMDTIPVGIY